MHTCEGEYRDTHTEIVMEDGETCPVCELRDSVREALKALEDCADSLTESQKPDSEVTVESVIDELASIRRDLGDAI